MKKAYVKPEMYFESFELSASIALSCGRPTLTPTDGTCGITIVGVPGVVFLNTVQDCDYKSEDGYKSYCYHQPSSTENLFNSQ